MEADKGKYPMGSVIHRYKDIIEAINWTLCVGLVIYLSYVYTWYFLTSLFIFPVIGAIIASICKSFTQIVYLFGMPVCMIIFVIKIIM